MIFLLYSVDGFLSVLPSSTSEDHAGQHSFHRLSLSHRVKAALKVRQNIVDMLRTNGQADGVGLDALIQKLLIGQLAVCRRRGMDHQTLHIRYVRQQGEDLQTVDKLVGFGLVAFDLKGEDGAAAIGEVFLIQLMVGMPGSEG